MIKVNGESVHLFADDYKPVEMYSEGKRVQGYIEETHEGRNIAVEGTYNDVLGLMCKGEHTQKTLKGYNQYNVDDVTMEKWITSSGEVIYGLYGSIGNEFSVNPTENVTAQISLLPYSCGFAFYDENGTFVYRILWQGTTLVAPKKFTATVPNKAKTARFIISIADQSGGLGSRITKEWLVSQNIMVERGSSFHDYEPYCGGIPSPNPQYPQEIVPTKAEAWIHTPNFAPYVEEYTLTGGAYIAGDAIVLPDAISRAIVRFPFRTDGYSVRVVYEAKCLDGEGHTYLGISYQDSNGDEITANGSALSIGTSWSTLTAYFGAAANINKYADAINKCETIALKWQRSVSYGEKPYAVRNIRLYLDAEMNDKTIYRTPQQLITDYELYGSDGVYDTLEPCVLVDGEWKCRVTRRWFSHTFDGTETLQTDNLSDVERKYNHYIYVGNNVFPRTVGIDSRAYCSHLPFMYWSVNNSNSVRTTSVLVLRLDKTIVGWTSPDDYYFKWKSYFAKQYTDGTPITVVFQRYEPTVELYDPIMLYTNPYATIINGNTEMIATMKTEDYSEAELLSLLSEEYERAIGEL